MIHFDIKSLLWRGTLIVYNVCLLIYLDSRTVEFLSTRNVDVILNQQESVYHELSVVDTVGKLDTQGGTALILVAQAIEKV